MNTTMTAKNSFQEGLIMDFSPATTRADCMTSALNATLLTFNGNEMSLQNDMGNGRVETAFLPEGYTPVGTCEFGDIIYIISYNPFINKALIGCFPSPERNISSEELHTPDVFINADDFQVLDSNNVPTGELKNTSVKKILFDTMHSGDLYVVYYKDLDTSCISDFGNTDHVKGKFPKFVKINIVSIEDSGKITYLDSSLKWYTNDYYLNVLNENAADEKTDIDSYQTLVSSAYNTFASKVPGKLALLFELERINSFNVSWECYQVEKNKYDLYWNFNWGTDNNDVNISKVLLYSECEDIIARQPFKQEYVISRHYCPEDKDITYENYKTDYSYDKVIETYKTYNLINRYESYNNNIFSINVGKYIIDNNTDPITIDDSIINNYFKLPVTKKCFRLTIDLNKNTIFKYTLTPCMPYGRLDDLAITGYIDFSKVGKNEIDLHTWKYYVYDNQISLTYGLNAYLAEGQEIDNITLEFYDNQGLAAIHNVPNKVSYNGTFTNLIQLDLQDSILSNIKNNERQYHYNGIYTKKENIKEDLYSLYFTSDATHLYKNQNEFVEIDFDKITWGTHKHDDENNIYIPATKTEVTKNTPSDTIVYLDDCGIIYRNLLYLVRIIINYGYPKSNAKQQKVIERWLWTTKLFNNKYHGTQDFDSLTPELHLDINGTYQGILSNWNYKTEHEIKNNKGVNELYQGLSAKVSELNSNDEPNVELNLKFGFVNDYNIFNLNANSNELDNIEVIITETDDSIENFSELPNVITANGQMQLLNSIFPISTTEKYETPHDYELYQSEKGYEKFKDWTKLKLIYSKYNNVVYRSSTNRDILFNNVSINNLNDNNFNINYDYFNEEVIKRTNLVKDCIYIDKYDENKIPIYRTYFDVDTAQTTLLYQLHKLVDQNKEGISCNFPDSSNKFIELYYNLTEITSGEINPDTITWEKINNNWYKDKNGSKYYKFVFDDGFTKYLKFIPITNSIQKIYTIKFLKSELDLNETLNISEIKLLEENTVINIGEEYLITSINIDDVKTKIPEDANIGICKKYYLSYDNIISDYDIFYISKNLLNEKYNKYFIKLSPKTYRMQHIPEKIIKYDATVTNFNELKTIKFDNDIVNITEEGYYAFCHDNNFETFKLYDDTIINIDDSKYKTIIYKTSKNEIKEYTSEEHYVTSVKNLLDDSIKFTLDSIKYNKYYFTTISKRQNVVYQTLRSLIIDKLDLENYNLVLAHYDPEDSGSKMIPYFKYGISLGFGNMAGLPSHIERNVIPLLSDTATFDAISMKDSPNNWKIHGFNSTGWIDAASGKDTNISYKQLADETEMDWLFTASDAGNNKLKPPFFPICLGYTLEERGGYTDDDKIDTWWRDESKKDEDSDDWLAVPNFWKKEGDLNLNGSFAIMNNYNVYIADDWSRGNVTDNARKLLCFLKNIYYISEETLKEELTNVINNYAYLDKNYSVYTKNINFIVQFNNSNTNDLLLIGGMVYCDYLDLLKESYKSIYSGASINNENNINFEFKNISKNIPFLFKQEYQTPYIELNSDIISSNNIKIDSIDSNIKVDGLVQFELGKLYGYDGKSIKPLSEVTTMSYYNNAKYNITNEDKIIIDTTTAGEITMNVSTLTKNNIFLLVTENDKEKLLYNGGEIYAPSSKTYSILFSKEDDTPIGITEFETNLKFFEDVLD